MITVRTTSNPVFRNLPKQEGNGYASFGSATAGASQATQQFGQPQYAPAEPYQTGPTSRAMTIDDVVTKTGIPPGVLTSSAQIGRASCRERVCQYVTISGVAGPLKKKIK